MKRQRTSGGSVTGGTGDIKPQIFTISTGTSAAVDDYTVTTFVLPVPRFGTMKTKATIFEILRVDWYLDPQDLPDTSALHFGFLTTSTNRTTGETATAVSNMVDFGDPRSFACIIRRSVLATNGSFSVQMPNSVNLTDDNGNGMLIATDRITIVTAGVGDTTVSDSVAKIYYRMVNVGIAEYVGIVQSQQ